MKSRLFLTLLFSLLFAYSESEPKLKILQEYAYFGKVKETERDIRMTIKYTNTGDSPLYIDEIRSNCPCLKAEFSTEALSPGDTTTFTMIYNPRHLGDVYQIATLYYNSETDERPHQNFRVIGEVIQ